jgi:hypothetical protein
MDAQTAQQPTQKRGGNPAWVRGIPSPNPTGRTRAMDLFDDCLAEFRLVHGREPTRMQLSDLRALGKHMAAAESSRTNANQSTRSTRSARLLRKDLGLDRTPAPAAPKTPLQTLDEHLAARHGGGE